MNKIRKRQDQRNKRKGRGEWHHQSQMPPTFLPNPPLQGSSGQDSWFSPWPRLCPPSRGISRFSRSPSYGSISNSARDSLRKPNQEHKRIFQGREVCRSTDTPCPRITHLRAHTGSVDTAHGTVSFLQLCTHPGDPAQKFSLSGVPVMSHPPSPFAHPTSLSMPLLHPYQHPVVRGSAGGTSLDRTRGIPCANEGHEPRGQVEVTL